MAIYSTPPGHGALEVYPEKMKRSAKAPDWRGLVVCQRNFRAGQVIRLVGWTITTPWGKEHINLKINDSAPGNKNPNKRHGWEGFQERKGKEAKAAILKEIRRKDAGDLPE